MPAGTSEVRHHHTNARQFFYVLRGTLTVKMQGQMLEIEPGAGLEIPPGLAHLARNFAAEPVRFLVISAPTARGDRVELGLSDG